MSIRKWVTPFTKQCFVVTGVSLNMASSGIVMGFTTGLLSQLKTPDSIISIDDNVGSWIAAAPGFTLVLGNVAAPIIMSLWGRKTANLISIVPLIIGWLSIAAAQNLIVLIAARFLQGISLGMVTVLSPVLIGEYSSPKNRGIFLMNISTLTSLMVLVVHTLSLYVNWQRTALIFSVVTFIDLIIVAYSPESPSWLASRGKYEETEKAFHWLRGNSKEEEELNKMIATNVRLREKKAVTTRISLLKKVTEKVLYFKSIAKRKEFYKPIIIMIHLYTLGQWAGINVMSVYTLDILKKIVGDGSDSFGYVIGLDVQRVISSTIAMIVIKKTKRRLMLFITTGINIAALIVTAAYTFAKEKYVLPYHDHPYIGVILIHFHMFAISCGTLPMPFIISGEIFPLEFRSLAGGISILFFSLSLTITVKTMPFLFKSIQVHGSYLLYAIVTLYSLLVAAKYLPETKDRTLQDIEEEFKGRHHEESKSVQPLIVNKDTSHKDYDNIIST